MQQPVTGEIESVDLDRDALSRDDKADITVQHIRRDFQIGVERHDDGEHLGRRNDASYRVDGQLLHDAVDRRGKNLLPGLLLPLDDVLGKPRGSLFGLCEIVVERAAVFRFRLCLGLA